MSTAAPIDRPGMLAAISAYVMWGVFPLYWALLKSVPALQIIAHRVIWCGVLVVGFLLLRGELRSLARAFGNWRVLRLLLLSSALISFNWGVFIWAVTHGHVVDASLGYFINPLMNVVLAVLVLHERLRSLQWTAVGLAGIGVLWLAFQHGEPPWIALALASSFSVYGLLRRWAAVDAVPGLAIENLVLMLPALGCLLFAEQQDAAVFLHGGAAQDLLLVLGGALTALPLIGFAYGARRIPYSLIGLLQYIAPTLQLLCGLLLLGETFHPEQAIGFGLIWLGLAIYAVEGWRRSRPSSVAVVDAEPEAAG